MKLSDDRRKTWPPLLTTSRPITSETLDERGQRYTIRNADLLVGDGLKHLLNADRGECYVRLSCEGPDGEAAVALLGPYRAKLAQSVVAALRKLCGQKLVEAGKIEINVP